MRQLTWAGAFLCLAIPAVGQNARLIFNVLDYGAKPDGSASSTAAFRDAIQACAKAGGGTVWIPAGNYVSGAIELVSNLTLHIDSGAVIRFADNREEYPMVKSRFEGVETMAPAAMIGGHNLENVTITGRGTLMAVNADWLRLMATPPHRQDWQQVLALIERKAAGEEIVAEPVVEEKGTVLDLMAALEASVAAAKEARKRHPTGRDGETAETAEAEEASHASVEKTA